MFALFNQPNANSFRHVPSPRVRLVINLAANVVVVNPYAE